MKLIIERSKWLRGEGTAASYLLRSEDSKMCCLGFFGLACGLEPERLTDISSPDYTPRPPNKNVIQVWTQKVPEAAGLFHVDKECNESLSVVCYELMAHNDDKNLSNEKREERIIRSFAEIGVEVSFVD